MYTIENLSKSSLTSASALRDRIFKGLSKCEKETLKMSLDINNKKYKSCLSQNQLSYLEYFVMLDPKTKQVIGLTGIYTEEKDADDICWLGWFCIDKDYRRRGLGKKLLEYSICKAKELNKQYLHLYTYNSEEFQPAIKFYEQYGFKRYRPSHKVRKRDFYYKLRIIK